MLWILIPFFLLGTTSAFYPPEITSESSNIQEHAGIGKFIELNENEQLVLLCSGKHDELEFVYPQMDDHKGYDEADFKSRIEDFSVDYNELKVVISNMKESDTGLYTCSTKSHSSLKDSVYVFVHGSSIFVPLTPSGYVYDVGEVVIPCKATKFFEKSEIELYGNGEHIKDARKNYDHKSGFKLTKKMYDLKPISQVPFECKYTGEPPSSTTYLITERDKTETTDYNLYWEEPMEWPYVGINYTLTCHLAYNGPGEFKHYINTLHVDCPQCSSESNHAVAERGRLRGNSINANIVVDTMTTDDSGNYTCRWQLEGREEEVVITKHVDVAPKRGQIKILERSVPLVHIKEGQPIQLSAKVTVFPKETEEYSAKWIRKYSTSIKSEMQSESLISDDLISITNQVDGTQFSEKLFIMKDTTTDMSGTYILSIVHSGTVENIEWQVAVENSEINTKISIREPSSFVVFDQPFYPPNTHLHIDCIAESIPPAKVHMEQRVIRDSDSEFNGINENQLQVVSGTYESGYIWNVTAFHDIEVRCTADRDGVAKTTTKLIRIADKEPTVSRKVLKSEKATSLENTKEIYEGDGIELDCILPLDTDWNVRWMFNQQEIPAQEIQKGHSKHIIMTIENVLASNAGDYACIVRKDDLEKRLVQKINVQSISRPYHSKSDPEEPMVVQYDDSIELTCDLMGNPMPDFEWLKDGNPYTFGEQHGAVLKIVRVRGEDQGDFVCRASNRAGTAERRIPLSVKGVPGSTSFVFIGIVLFVLIIFILLTLIAFLRQKRITKRKSEALSQLYQHFLNTQMEVPVEALTKLPIDQRVYQLPYKHEYELRRENLEVGDLLGSGNFGVVYAGLLKKAKVTDEVSSRQRLSVAVKAPLNGYDVKQQRMLAEELKIMCAIGKHPNVLALVGAVTKNMRNGELFVVIELCENGNLLQHLLKNRSNFLDELKIVNTISNDGDYLQPASSKKTKYAAETDPEWETQRLLNDDKKDRLCTSDLISYAMQIANGMEYLSSVPCVHRDLAARNVLLTSNKVCRVADFGMARRHEDKSYYRVKKSKEQVVPIRWMSLEAIQQQKYTEESDVWAFGIVLYEIFSLGGKPYPTVSHHELEQYLIDGHRNSKPTYCHEEIYDLMMSCWAAKPEKRPTFANCVYFIKEHIKKASPKLLERLEDVMLEESRKQNELDVWLAEEDSDYHVLAQSSTRESARYQDLPLQNIG